MDILFSLYTSLIICGVYASTWDGMIFGSIRAKIEMFIYSKFGNIKASKHIKDLDKAIKERYNTIDFILKPFFNCIVCMSSFWGGGIYLLYKGFNIGIIPHILTVAGINTIVSGIIFLAYERNTNE